MTRPDFTLTPACPSSEISIYPSEAADTPIALEVEDEARRALVLLTPTEARQLGQELIERAADSIAESTITEDHPCLKCGAPVGNGVFTWCDDCWT